MSQPMLVTGAAGGAQGSTGRRVTESLLERGFSVRALVHKLDERSDRLRAIGAEDVARVATALLISDTKPTKNGYDLIVELPTVIEVADTLTRALGRPIRY